MKNKQQKLQKNNLEILSSKNKIKLVRYLVKTSDWSFNINELSKEVSINKGTLSRLIKQFENKNIILVKRKGKLLLFKLNLENSLVKDLITPIFNLESKINKK